jgi:hypothetical protein
MYYAAEYTDEITAEDWAAVRAADDAAWDAAARERLDAAGIIGTPVFDGDEPPL